MKSVLGGLVVVALIAVAAYFVLGLQVETAAEAYSSPASVRLDDGRTATVEASTAETPEAGTPEAAPAAD